MGVNFSSHMPTPWLDGKHTVFGAVVEGQSVVDVVAQEDSIDKIEILRIGKDAENWDAVAAFHQFNELAQKRIEVQKEKQAKELQKITGFFRKQKVVYVIKLSKRDRRTRLLQAKKFLFITKVNFSTALYSIHLTRDSNLSILF